MTTPEVLMDYDQVAGLIEQVGGAETALGDGRADLANAPNTHSSYGTHYVADFNAFGNAPAAAGLARSHSAATSAALTAAQHLAAALADDAIRLDEVMRCFQETDHQSADALCAVTGGQSLTVYSTHVHASGSQAVVYPHPDDVWPRPGPHDPIWDQDPPGPTTQDDPSTIISDSAANDHVRAGQIDRFREIFNENPGVVGGDFNVEVQDDAGGPGRVGGTVSAGALTGFEEDGHNVNAGRLEDQPIVGADGQQRGGTSVSGFHIDYVITAPGITTSEAERVDGRTSDHDGQRVDLTVPRW